MKRIKLILVIIIFLITIVVITISCNNTQTADTLLQEKTTQQMYEANKQIGMPSIKNFQERKLMKMILELHDDENLICYAYLYNKNTGEIGQFIGKCLGFGLPYSIQYTNPVKIVNGYNYVNSTSGYEITTVPQADPNGLFMPTGLSATWLMLLDDKGNPHPVYVEPEIIVSPFKLK